jgi:tetratricopeptide (TPR) repeat protein
LKEKNQEVSEMKKIAGFALFFTFSINVFSQNNKPDSLLDTNRVGVVYNIPATKKVKAKLDVPYLSDAAGTLVIDIYLPPNAKKSARFPAVIFLDGIGSAGGDKVSERERRASFPRLVAAHGMVGISMETDKSRIQESFRALFDFLEKNGAKYNIDAARLGVYAASANTTEAGRFLMSEAAPKAIKAASFYYGFAPQAPLRKDLPVLFVLAEGDMSGYLGRQALGLWQKVAESRAPWTLLFASNQNHAFDFFSDTDEARRIIQQTITFWKTHLEPVPQPGWKPLPAREIMGAAYYSNNPQKTADLLTQWIAEHPTDALAYVTYGRALTQLKRTDEAAAALEKALALGGAEAGIYFNLGQLRNQQKRYAEAADHFTKAIELGGPNGVIFLQLGTAQMELGRHEEALKTFERALEGGIAKFAVYYNMAYAYVRLRQTDKAFAMLGKAIDEGFANRNGLETDPALAPLRADTRFQALLNRLPKAAS